MSKEFTFNRQERSAAGLLSLGCCVAITLGSSWVKAQEPEKPHKGVDTYKSTAIAEERSEPGCARCHSCSKPTPENTCLLVCTRDETAKRGVYLLEESPDVVILNELEDAYLPVPFDHRGHAEMAEMARGCVTCHHHTPEGRRYPSCRTCHDVSAAGTDIRKPGLKGAYHQQCLNCHRDWIDETDCAKCHVPKAGRLRSGEGASALTKGGILGRLHPLGQMHPPIPEPDTVIYHPESKEAEGSRVIFRHREHVRRFGLNCVDCHHERSCARCHTEERARRQIETLAEPHKPCILCHERDINDAVTGIAGRCERCHWREGQPEPGRFDHADTGWPLGRFHEDRGCRDCHRDVPLVGLDNDCNACHSHWSPSVFDHRVTGQVLDDNHAEHDCELCHIERRFDRPPTCDECHDEEDDGITFPARRPGPGVRFEPSKPPAK